MRRWRTPFLPFVTSIALFVSAAGCGGGGGGENGGAVFHGTVSGITPAPTPTSPPAPTPTSTPLPIAANGGVPFFSAAHKEFASLVNVKWWLPSAVASSCTAQRVLACAAPLAAPTPTPTTGLPSLTPTPTPALVVTPANTPTPSCSAVDSTTCEFQTEVRPSQGGSVSVFFVDDTNDNKSTDSGESTATLDNALGAVCDGDVYNLRNVVVDFSTAAAHATPLVKEVDGCTPTPGPTRTPTVSPTPSCLGTGASCIVSFQCCSQTCLPAPLSVCQ